jgi:chemotaxis methyl-accepting protein methylase
MAHSVLVKKLAAVGREMWGHLPPPTLEKPPIRDLGHLIHRVVRRYGDRSQSMATYFLRNNPLMETVTEQIKNLHPDGTMHLGIIGCSTGAEVYSVVWMIRSTYPSLPFLPLAMDISAAAVEKAKAGHYRIGSPELRKELPRETLRQIFDLEGDELKVKPWISKGIQWMVADARDPSLVDSVGPQDIVFANNFLVHMKLPEAKQCMTNLLQLLRPGALFVCRGVDLDVRESVVQSSGLEPVTTRIEEIHYADPAIDAPKDWPWRYWGLEPLDKTRRNWALRYAAIFREPHHA